MSDIKTGGPAFPVATSDSEAPVQVGNFTWQFPGLTMRDYFAAKAMTQGMAVLVASGNNLNGYQLGTLAKTAYLAADAMLKEREA